MTCRITKSFRFDAAHHLPEVAPGHKCGRLHGHTYVVKLGLEGKLHSRMGWVQDYGDVSAAFAPLLDKFDHHNLNEIDGLQNSTAEIMAVWIYEQLKPTLPLLTDVTVCETPTTEATYRP